MRFSVALFAALAVLSLLVLPLAVLGVGAMSSETTTDASAGTDRVNDSPARFEEGITLHVRGDGPRERVTAELVEAFEARGVEVRVVDTLDRQYDGNVLVVTLGARDSSYTPFRATGSATWAYSYR
jgi:ABC-type glycerol-3-phosphate transport system substrate-binding protein